MAGWYPKFTCLFVFFFNFDIFGKVSPELLSTSVCLVQYRLGPNQHWLGMWEEAHIGAVLKTATSSPPWTHSFTLPSVPLQTLTQSAPPWALQAHQQVLLTIPNIPNSFLLLSILQLVFASTFALLQLVFIITSEVLLNTSCSYGLVQVRLARPLWPGPLLPLSLCLTLLLRTASFCACAALLLLLSLPGNSLSSKSAPLSTFSQVVNCHPTATHILHVSPAPRPSQHLP